MIDFKQKGSGIILHITSLPSKFGIGDIGPEAYSFVDFLHGSGQSYWQILPLNPVSEFLGSCPYSSYSAFAGSPLLISPEIMAREGWLMKNEIETVVGTPSGPNRVDYSAVREYKTTLFHKAYERFANERKHLSEYTTFCRQQAYWLEDFALYVVLKDIFNGEPWNKWPEDIRMRKTIAIEKYRNNYSDQIAEVKFLQYVFYKQWGILRSYAHKRGIQIIGDLPIYISYDSADVWSNPLIFKLDENGEQKFVAGVPPDYFSATGQRWGNPVYDWEELKATDFDWWIKRLMLNMKMFDILRIDHFRGLIAYWEIPAHEPTAVVGQWVPVPHEELFKTLKKHMKHVPIIAEDLGIITDDVKEAMEYYKFPGMKVLQFAFNGEQETHPYLPHNFGERSVVYTGTHDNNTTIGWYENEANDEAVDNLNRYLKKSHITRKSINWDLISLAMKSDAWLSMYPMQDILGLDANSRMNIPGTISGNWEWRFTWDMVNPQIKNELKKKTVKTGRI
jgi:4-alpha-glucanotransferase